MTDKQFDTIVKLIQTTKEELSQKIDEVDARLSARIDNVENRITELDTKLSKEMKDVETRLSRQIAELTIVSGRISTEEKDINKRLVHLEGRIANLEERVDKTKEEVINTKEELMQLIEEKDGMRTRQIQSLNDTIEKRYCRLDKRIKSLQGDLNLAHAV